MAPAKSESVSPTKTAVWEKLAKITNVALAQATRTVDQIDSAKAAFAQPKLPFTRERIVSLMVRMGRIAKNMWAQVELAMARIGSAQAPPKLRSK